jgi:thioredoxin-related protein
MHMKRFSFLLALFAFQFAFAGGNIHFSDASWEEAKKLASTQNKYLFVDCYTDWCYWCKVMDKETFTDTSVSNLVNSRFIPMKREMEKDKEGMALSMKYHVNGYPTYLVFSPAGEFVYKIVGSLPAAEFRKELEAALQKTAPLVPGFGSALDPGYPDFYRASFGTSKQRKYADPQTVCAWLDKQDDLFNEVNWSVLWRFRLNEKYDEWILTNRERLRELYGAEEVDEKIASVLSLRVSKAAESKDDAVFQQTLDLVHLYLPEQEAELRLAFSMEFYEKTKDWTAFATSVDDHIAGSGYANSGVINSAAWTIYEQCEDESVVKRAITWMDSICAKTDQYAMEDTYAALLYKDGQYARAEEVALNAIEMGKAAGEDVAATEALLTNIRQKRR